MTWPPDAWKIPVPTRAERDAGMVFRYNTKRKNPLTSLHTMHTWFSPNQTYCVCGRFSKEDPRLKEVPLDELKAFNGLLCRRCTWSDPDAQRRLTSGKPC